jgi:hypothetical protein
MHERFEWIAGRQLRQFGYASSADGVRGAGRVLRHRIMDWRWRAKTLTQRGAYRARVRLGTASRPLRERLGLTRTER